MEKGIPVWKHGQCPYLGNSGSVSLSCTQVKRCKQPSKRTNKKTARVVLYPMLFCLIVAWIPNSKHFMQPEATTAVRYEMKSSPASQQYSQLHTVTCCNHTLATALCPQNKRWRESLWCHTVALEALFEGARSAIWWYRIASFVVWLCYHSNHSQPLSFFWLAAL